MEETFPFEALARLEEHRMHELSRGMIQQVYNDNTYKMDIWGCIRTVVAWHCRDLDVARINSIMPLAWQYGENTVRVTVSADTTAYSSRWMDTFYVCLTTGEVTGWTS